MSFRIRNYSFIGICFGFLILSTPFGGLGFTNSLVFQSGDTIKFFRDEKLITQWILKDSVDEIGGYTRINKAKVSPDNKFLLFYEEQLFGTNDSIFSKLTLYNAHKNKIWSRIKAGERKISFELASIFEDMVIVFYTDRLNGFPIMEMIHMNGVKKTIDLRQWDIVINYELSANRRYMLFHAKKPYMNKLWDYIYFLDLKTNKTWEYLFPTCFSCKRGWVELKVDNNGRCEVIQNKEYRIFNKEGSLLDIFVRFD